MVRRRQHIRAESPLNSDHLKTVQKVIIISSSIHFFFFHTSIWSNRRRSPASRSIKIFHEHISTPQHRLTRRWLHSAPFSGQPWIFPTPDYVWKPFDCSTGPINSSILQLAGFISAHLSKFEVFRRECWGTKQKEGRIENGKIWEGKY